MVEHVVRATLAGLPPREITWSLAAAFGLSADDAELACDRTQGGFVRAATGNPQNCPDPAKDPIAWESFQRGMQDPSLAERFFPR